LEQFFRERTFQPVRQDGPHCVSTALAILTGALPETFQGKVNTQDPRSWSLALQVYDMKLAYCPSDVRKLKFYCKELLEIDDLFTLSVFTPTTPGEILADPNEDGWVCSSHVVVLHRGVVLDPATGRRSFLKDFVKCECHTKRIFRVVPASHARGL
jgi:hypothetical protein